MSDRTGELLLKGLRQLSQAEQDEVVAGLLGGLVAGTARPTVPHFPPTTPFTLTSPSASAEVIDLLTRGERTGVSAGDTDLKVLPVRLPAADYDRLREWSRAHGFSMAVIIRTLVERFVDGQQRRAERQPPPAEAAAPEAAPARPAPAEAALSTQPASSTPPVGSAPVAEPGPSTT